MITNLLQGTKPPLLVTQHQQSPRQLVLLSATGAHVLTFLRPVDQLRQMLEESGGAESNIVKEFFSAMTPTQACATALIIATDPHRPNAQVCMKGCLFFFFLFLSLSSK